MAITVTPSAAKKLAATINDTGLSETTYVRLSIKGGGCAGFSYSIDFDEKKTDLDNTFDFDVDGRKFTLLVDPKSYLMINGTVVDYINTLMEQRFTFDNPLAKGQCGCGTSFAV